MTTSFFAGPMGCGKTTLLLQDVHNLGRRSLVLTGSEFGSIQSRVFGTDKALDAWTVRTAHDLTVPLACSKGVGYIFVDEAQFLNEGAVRKLFRHANDNGVNVRFYGLISDHRI